MKILVIGDSCVDIFRYGEVNRLAPEAPIPIIKPKKETSCPGMAGNVVENLKALGAEVDFVTNTTEIRKIRYVCSKYNHLLLRVDENDKCENISLDTIDILNDHQQQLNNYFDAVVISDYNKGFLDVEDIKHISTSFPCPVFLDTKKELGDWCLYIDYIKINSQEFNNSKSKIDEKKSLYNKIIVTRGKLGCDYQGINYPTTEVPVKDVSGAGDTFLAGLVVEYIKTNNIKSAINFAQECTTKVVQKTGISTI
jgi:bifunctional ADP-heptose synthase (sugar kinase/adenylyltransferase)